MNLYEYVKWLYMMIRVAACEGRVNDRFVLDFQLPLVVISDAYVIFYIRDRINYSTSKNAKLH